MLDCRQASCRKEVFIPRNKKSRFRPVRHTLQSMTSCDRETVSHLCDLESAAP